MSAPLLDLHTLNLWSQRWESCFWFLLYLQDSHETQEHIILKNPLWKGILSNMRLLLHSFKRV